MCGIFAIQKKSKTHINEYLDYAIRSMTYRGYDSWGVKTASQRITSIDKYHRPTLDKFIDKDSDVALAHTRWATNGEVNIRNAHPISRFGYSIVHNGVLTNPDYIKSIIPKYKYLSDTDTEVLLLAFIENVKHLNKCEGNFAFVILSPDNEMFVYRKDVPLYYCKSIRGGTTYIVSDVNSCKEEKINFNLLPENTLISMKDYKINEFDYFHHELDNKQTDKLKSDTITENELKESVGLIARKDDSHFFTYKNIFIGSGSSYNAALYGAYMSGGRAYVPTDKRVINGDKVGHYVLLSQSGESFDIIKLLNNVKSKRHIKAITNNPNSTLAREANAVINLDCGAEYGVASTKTFMQQLKVLSGIQEHTFSPAQLNDDLVRVITSLDNLFILGSDIDYIIAREAALKFKELSLVHAEAIEATEFKHGPLALTDKNFYAIILGNHPALIEQIKARKGRIYNIIDDDIFRLTYQLQELALHVAYAKGIDPDYPRNLAKAITVE